MSLCQNKIEGFLCVEKKDGLVDFGSKLHSNVEIVFIFEGETKMPFHHVEGGDIYVLLAEKAMEFSNAELALENLEKAIKYDIEDKEELIASGFKIESPFLSNVGGRLGDRFQNLDEIMSKECFAPLCDNERYKKMLNDIEDFKKRAK